MRVLLLPALTLLLLAIVAAAISGGCAGLGGGSGSEKTTEHDEHATTTRPLNPVLQAHAERGELHAGMDAHAVVELLGNPAREYQCHAPDHDERWVYLTLEGPVDFYLEEGRLVRWEAGLLPADFQPSPHPEFWLWRTQHVQALVFDANGACVDTLLNEVMPVGSISLEWVGWPGREGARDESIFHCRIVTEDTTFTRKLARLP